MLLLLNLLLFQCASVRVDDWEVPSAEPGCGRTRCAKASGSRVGLYALYGEAAREASSWATEGEPFFLGRGGCNRPWSALGGDASAVAVPWVDGQDPINGSRLELYLDPTLELQLSFAAGNFYICRGGGCVCQVTGYETTEWKMLARLAMAMPSVPMASKLLELQGTLSRRCPDAGALDLAMLCWTVLMLLFFAICIEASLVLWCAGATAEPTTAGDGKMPSSLEEDAAMKIDAPLQIFGTGFGWILGFIASVMTLQTVVLFLVKKSDTLETVIWLLIYFPCLLAAGGAYRLTNLLCKKQLLHAFLRQGICLTGPSGSTVLDALLFVALCIYALAVVLSVGSGVSLRASALVSLALVSPAWTLVKALRNAQETEKKMDQLIFVSRVDRLSAKAPSLLTWHCLVSASRCGLDFREVHGTGDDVNQVDFNFFRDLPWHRRRMADTGAAWSGAAVLPAFALMIFGFAGISILQALSYACSAGELADLRLASSRLSLAFRPWQQKYTVQTDVSFKQATLVAMADAPSTRWIAFQQPDSTTLPAPSAVEEDNGAVTEEIRLSRKRIPRVATVRTQGLRPSLPPTERFIRFSPLKTLPATLGIIAAGSNGSIAFNKTLAWSALPRSTISLPPEVVDFNVTVALHDFFLGLPEMQTYPAPGARRGPVWTVFEAQAAATEESCGRGCEENLDCLSAFPGKHGCFQAYNNHSHRESAAEAASAPPVTAGHRTLRGQLAGCRLRGANDTLALAAGACTTSPVLAEHHVIRFGSVRPDWLGDMARLEFSLLLEVGEQEFMSEVVNLDFRQGLPVPTNLVTLLRRDGAPVPSHGIVGAMEATVKVMEYDPTQVHSTLQLLLLPLLPDRSFDVQWLLPLVPGDDDLKAFQMAEQCVNSKLVQRRYEVCGAQGPLKDKPVAVQVMPWTGQLQDALDFFVVPRGAAPGQWPSAPRWTVKLQFDGVDSPAAWAARKHGCRVVGKQFQDEVANALASSADALCALMDQEPSCGESVCDLLKRSLGNGKSRSFTESNLRLTNGAMLPPEGIVKVLSCHEQMQVPCEVGNVWDYRSADGTLQLQGTGAAVPADAFVVALGSLGAAGLELLRRQRFPDAHLATGLHFQLASGLWKVPNGPSAELVRTLASKSIILPKTILEAMIQLKAGDSIQAEASSLQAAFAKVRSVTRSFQDARQLKFAALALRLAPQVTTLLLSCKACPTIAKEALMTDWEQLLSRFQQLERLHLDGFSMTRPQLLQRLADALRASQFTSLTLIDCPWAGDVRSVARAIGSSRALTELELSSLPVPDDWPLGEAILNLTGLKKLTYSLGNPTVARDLLQRLAQRPVTSLEVFSLEGDQLGPEAAPLLSKLLPELPKLRELRLASNHLDDSCASTFIQTFSKLTDLAFVDVGRNNFTAATEQRISQAARASHVAHRDPLGRPETTGTLRKPPGFAMRKLPGRAAEMP